VLRAFLAGRIPGARDLGRWCKALAIELDDALAELRRRDAVWLDSESGSVAVAYPFSGTPTPHEVELADSGVRAFAMCAIDALGVAFMADRAATVRSRDAETAERIEVRIDPAGSEQWEPPGAVVMAAVSGNGPNASSCCPHVNFLASRQQAEKLLEASSASQASILEIPEAIDLGKTLFGTLLHDERSS
jgi:hypothetical protein